jgi:hypothetical protein
VTDGPGRRGDLLFDRSRRVQRPPRARIPARRAMRAAREHTGARRLRAPARASLAILPERAGSRLVWRVLVPSAAPLASFEVLVDAGTARVARVRDLLRRATGLAMVFDTNPVVAQGSRSQPAVLTDGNTDDADSQALTDLRRQVELPRLDDAPNACLIGAFAHATLPGDTEVCAPSLDFRGFTRSDDEFEAVMAYFHADRVQAHIRSLGFANVMNRQLKVNANESFPDVVDNAFYDQVTKEISLGVGNNGEGVDTGEDGEVTAHEYGHAIQDDQVPGFGQSLEGGAMGEGFGDYLAAAIANEFEPSASFDPCLAEWFALGLGDPDSVPCLRRVDRDLTPAQVAGPPCGGEVHCAGEAWSGVLWDIRGTIGADTADRLVIQSHFSLTSGAGFAEGARALLAADRALYGGIHLQFLRDLLVGRGFVSVERLDDTPPEATPLPIPAIVAGQLGSAGDDDDVYGLDLTVGRGIVVRMASAAEEFDLRLLRPDTASVDQGGASVAESTAAGSNESIAYVAAQSGLHYLDVTRIIGAGGYSLQVLPDHDGDTHPDSEDNCVTVGNFGQADRDRDGQGDGCDRFPDDPANDADGDGLAAHDDNCPRRANRGQADWDGDGRGDACDRSARATLEKVAVRGFRVRLRGSLRPRSLPARSWRVHVRRRVCRRGRCGFRRVGEFARARRIGRGRVQITLRLGRPGLYRFRAVLRDRRYRSARSRSLHLRLPA